MKVIDIIKNIERELVPLGKYAPGLLQADEIKLALDSILAQIFNDVCSNKKIESSPFITEFFSTIKSNKNVTNFNIVGDELIVERPEDSEIILSCNVIYYKLEPYTNKVLEINETYKPKSQAKINGSWTTSITKAESIDYLGEVYKVNLFNSPIRLVESEKKKVFKNIPFYKTNIKSLLGEVVGNKIIIDLPCNLDISYVNITFYKKLPLFKDLSDLDESPYRDIVNRELMNKIKQI